MFTTLGNQEVENVQLTKCTRISSCLIYVHTQGFINSLCIFSADVFQNCVQVTCKYLTALLVNFFNASIFKIVSPRAVSDVLAVEFYAFYGKELTSKSFLSLFHVFKISFPSG